MELNADFYTAPASTKYHGGYLGGLCQHSIDVYQYARKLAFLMSKEPSEESLAISTLFHGICKVNLYKKGKRNQKINGCKPSHAATSSTWTSGLS